MKIKTVLASLLSLTLLPTVAVGQEKRNIQFAKRYEEITFIIVLPLLFSRYGTA